MFALLLFIGYVCALKQSQNSHWEDIIIKNLQSLPSILASCQQWFKLNSLFYIIWALTSAQAVTLRYLGKWFGLKSQWGILYCNHGLQQWTKVKKKKKKALLITTRYAWSDCYLTIIPITHNPCLQESIYYLSICLSHSVYHYEQKSKEPMCKNNNNNNKITTYFYCGCPLADPHLTD